MCVHAGYCKCDIDGNAGQNVGSASTAGAMLSRQHVVVAVGTHHGNGTVFIFSSYSSIIDGVPTTILRRSMRTAKLLWAVSM